jgi:catechol 2,3-dioxygenase-like lactoylglutathione lyase family enzyme
MINRIDHTALVVRDLAQTIDFYTRVLGFHIARRLNFPDRELVILALGEEPAAKLELLRYDATDPADSVPDDRTRLGLRHLAFHVSNVGSVYEQLAAAGVRMQAEPPFRRPGGPPIAFGYDPNGVLLEFSEIS